MKLLALLTAAVALAMAPVSVYAVFRPKPVLVEIPYINLESSACTKLISVSGRI